MKLKTAILISAVFVAFAASAAQAGSKAPDIDYNALYEDGSVYNPPFVNSAVNVQPEKIATILRLDYKSWKEVPPIFAQFIPGEHFDRPEGITIFIALTNDYNILGPIGVKRETDDHGLTHAAQLSIGGFLPNGYYITLDYSTQLFTKEIGGIVQKANGDRVDQQYFTNENVLKVVVDSIDKNRAKGYYWRVEAGWQQLNSNSRGGALSGATHQEKFHDLMNSIRTGQTKTPQNVRDGLGTRDGAILGLYMGVAKEFLNAKNTCRVRLFAEGGPRGSTISGASFIASDAGGVLWCQRGDKAVTYRVGYGYQSKVHEGGYEGTQYLDLSAGKNNWRLGFRFEQSHGDLINYVNYNLKNGDNGKIDPLFILYYRYSF